MSIEVKGIKKKYQGQSRLAVDDVSFSIKGGEVVGFLGPNGAGKSTIMKILTSYIPPSQGVAKICGLDVLENSLESRKKIGYLPEHNPLYLDMYVKEFLTFCGRVYKVKNLKERVAEMVKVTGLEKEQNKKIRELSKGYRQRVGLAKALIHDPEVLILDEPTTGLDPLQLEEIRGLVKEIGKTKTIMLSTHIMQEVEAICDRVIIINQGKIIADDQTENLLASKRQNVLIVEFEQAVTRDQLEAIEDVIQVQEWTGNSWRVHAENGKDIRKTLFEYAVKNDLSVLSLTYEETRLEDIFKTLARD